jgi:hypothetical protein
LPRKFSYDGAQLYPIDDPRDPIRPRDTIMMAPAIEALAKSSLAWKLQVGYATRQHIIDCVCDRLGEEYPDIDPRSLGADMGPLFDAVLDELRQRELAWSSPSDHDRLVAALTALDAAGIVSRECYGVTIKDAESKVEEEAARAVERGERVRGYCTFNIQDAEAGALDGMLFLSFGDLPPTDDEGACQIGDEIADCLRRAGLSVVWTRQRRDRIGVEMADWRVRRFTVSPDRPTTRGPGFWGTVP